MAFWFRGLLVAAVVLTGAALGAEEAGMTTTVFRAGEDGYDTYRIPAIVCAKDGTLLAFCEGRVGGRGDSGNIDLVLKRSGDGGATWSPLQVVWDDAANTCGNPAPVVLDSGEILLALTWNDGNTHEREILEGKGAPRTVWLTRSTDHGKTWSPPRDISHQARRDDWRWYATGPGHAIQLPSGRVVVACDHSLSPDYEGWHSHVIYSDDAGATWAIGGVVGPRTNESTVAALADGRLYLNMRSRRVPNQRAVAWSDDQGETWGPVMDDANLVEPICQGSCLRLQSGAGLLFSNPASTNRERMTVRLSMDGGETWPRAILLYPGPAAYSDLVQLESGQLACLYERGNGHPYETIVLTRFALEDMTWLPLVEKRLHE